MYDLDGNGYEEILIHRGNTRSDGKTKQVTHIFRPDFIVSTNDENTNVISGYSLEQNYPNPFNPFTTISYNLPKQTFVSLNVLVILWNEVA